MNKKLKFHPRTVFGTVDQTSIGSSFVISAIPSVFVESNTRSLFAEVPHPTHKDDWLAQYDEYAQSFDEWQDHPLREELEKRPFVVLTIGALDGGPDMNVIKEYLSAFLPGVELIYPEHLDIVKTKQRHSIVLSADDCDLEVPLKKRHGHRDTKDKYVDAHVQYLANSFSHVLTHYKTLHNAYGVIAITMADLHMDTTDEFAMGQANYRDRISISSFGRYSPRFQQNYVESHRVEDADALLSVDKQIKLITARCAKTLAHEIMHLFQVEHCTYKDCLMRGSGHLKEDYAISPHLCLVDLHKIAYVLSANRGSVIDVAHRFHALAIVFDKMDESQSADWCRLFVQKTTGACSKPVAVNDDDDSVSLSECAGQKGRKRCKYQ